MMIMTHSLKKVIGIFSMMIAILILCIFDISRLVVFKNMTLGVIYHLIMLIGITQIFYLGGLAIGTIITKIHWVRNARKIQKFKLRNNQKERMTNEVQNENKNSKD